MIVYNVPMNAQRMTIGVQGENNVRQFLFDVTEWRQLTGNIGTAQMIVQRNGDSSPYATTITMADENTVSWIPSNVDTAKKGVGKIQLMWIASGQTVKTKVFDMKVDRALDYDLPDDSLDPWASWMPDIINAALAVENFPGTVADVTAEWLEDNIGPTTPAIDKTLLVEGAGADAKKTGEEIADLKSALLDVYIMNAGELIESPVDYNTFLNVGSWRVANSVVAKNSTNCPANSKHRLDVIGLFNNSSRIQRIITETSLIMIRIYDGTNFTEWVTISTSENADKNILKELEIHQGYYYDKDGNKVSNTKFNTVENVPYDVAFSYFAPCKPAMYFMDEEGNKIEYVSGSANVLNYTLPLVGGAKKVHISYNAETFPAFYVSRSARFNSRYAYRSCAVYGDSIAKGNYANIGGVVQSVDCAFTKLACDMLGISTFTNHAIGGSAFCTASSASSTIWHNQISDGYPATNEADLIIVSAGTNDWGHDSPLGTLGDTSPTTFYGAVYATLNSLRNANPLKMIIVVTPLYRGSGTALEVYEATHGSTNLKMADYINAIKDVCNVLNIACMDMANAELHPVFTPSYFFTDHLHPIQRGHNVMGLALAEKINELTMIENPPGT